MSKPLDDTLPTGPTSEWIELCDLIRGHLIRIARTPNLEAGELKFLIDAAKDARWCEVQARTMDAELERRNNNNPWDNGCSH